MGSIEKVPPPFPAIMAYTTAALLPVSSSIAVTRPTEVPTSTFSLTVKEGSGFKKTGILSFSSCMLTSIAR